MRDSFSFVKKTLFLFSVISGRLQAYYICGILGKLNLNFLKLPEETTFLTPLKKDEIQVYKPRVLMRYNKILREPFFKSVLQQYAVPLKTNGQSQDDYDKSMSLFPFLYTWNYAMNVNILILFHSVQIF